MTSRATNIVIYYHLSSQVSTSVDLSSNGPGVTTLLISSSRLSVYTGPSVLVVGVAMVVVYIVGRISQKRADVHPIAFLGTGLRNSS